MPIDKNNPDYNGAVQKTIWNYATNLLPLEITLPMIPEEMREPCTDMYNFTVALLNDMYKNTEEYGFGKKYVLFHQWFFYWLYKKFKFYDGAFVIDKKGYKKFAKRFNPKTVETMYARHGFELVDFGDQISLSNSRYPGMMKAIFEVFAAAYMNYGASCGCYLTECEFRALVNYKRTYADMFFVLTEEDKAMAKRISDYAAGIGVKPAKCDFFHRIAFRKKNKVVFMFNVAQQKNLKIDIGFAKIGGEAFMRLEKEIEKYDDATGLRQFIIKYSCKRCNNCSPKCHHKFNPIEVFGKKMVICGNNLYIRIREPKEQDLKYIIKLIELRAMLVDSEISESFFAGNVNNDDK